jgi:hypothetical protein
MPRPICQETMKPGAMPGFEVRHSALDAPGVQSAGSGRTGLVDAAVTAALARRVPHIPRVSPM